MTSILNQLEQRLAADFTRYHIRTQALRLVAGVGSTFALQLGTGTGNIGWKATLATLFGIVFTAARQLWPTLPWRLVTDHLHAAQTAEPAPRTGMAANPPTLSISAAPSGPVPGA